MLHGNKSRVAIKVAEQRPTPTVAVNGYPEY